VTMLSVAMPPHWIFTEFKSGLFGSEFLSSMNSGTLECRQMPNFRANEDLCKLGKKYLNASLCKSVFYSLQYSETYDISHVFLSLTNAELSMLKQIQFFWPTLYIYSSIMDMHLNFCISYTDSQSSQRARTITLKIENFSQVEFC